MQNWLRLIRFLKPHRLRFAGGILFGMLNSWTNYLLVQGIPVIFSTVFPPSSPKNHTEALFGFGKNALIDRFVNGLLSLWNTLFGETPSQAKIIATVLLVPATMILRALTDYLSNYLLSWVGVRIITDIRQKVFVHTQKLSLDFYNKSNVGDLISRLVNDCQQAQSAITTVIADSIKHPFTIVVVGWAILQADWRFSLSAVVLAPLCILPIAIYGRKVRKTSKLSQENQGEILSHLHENITGVRVVKGFGMEKQECEKFWQTCYRQFSYQMRIVRSINILNPLIEIVASFGVMAALYYAYHVHMPVGTLAGLLFGIFALYTPIKNLSKLHTTIQKSLASTDRIFAILDTEPTVKEAPAAIQLPPIRNDIQLKDVSFRYDDHPVLQNISLDIAHGKTLALVGPSGAGKSTLLSLLLRFYDPISGHILIDGHDIRGVTFESLRKQMAIVTQDTILFNDSIRNNIRYGSIGATEKQIVEAASRAFANEFILTQPMGYDTVVGDKGVKLSGGQKQRIAIARAILRNPSILLLDEATSALDTESERFVQAALDELIEGRTVVVIAHRLSTVQKADQIVVMERGRIVEKGRHDELLARGKLYRKLYDLQFQEV